MAAHGTEPSSGVSLGKADDDHSDAQHAWGQDPDIRGALEGTATDQVRAMGVSATVAGDTFRPDCFVIADQAPSLLKSHSIPHC